MFQESKQNFINLHLDELFHLIKVNFRARMPNKANFLSQSPDLAKNTWQNIVMAIPVPFVSLRWLSCVAALTQISRGITTTYPKWQKRIRNIQTGDFRNVEKSLLCRSELIWRSFVVGDLRWEVVRSKVSNFTTPYSPTNRTILDFQLFFSFFASHHFMFD